MRRLSLGKKKLFGQTTPIDKRANYSSIVVSPIRFACPTQRQELPIVLQIKASHQGVMLP